MKILIADDERDLCDAVRKIVERRGHSCLAVLDGGAVLETYRRERPDLVILDVMMPEVNGFDLCREIRELDAKVPIIMLSAKSDIVDKSIGFAAGCDDYVAKPFNGQELLMRIEAHLRRHRDDLSFARAAARVGSSTIGDLEVNFSSYAARKAGSRVELTGKEFEILALLAANPGKVYTRQQIYEHIWGEDTPMDANSITVFIHRIREKIEDNASKPRYLLTVWGVGYKFADRVD